MVDKKVYSSPNFVNKKPLISFVLAGRNDNYGGDFRLRLQRSISSLFKQLNTFKIDSEIIFVNYNPLTDSEISNFIAWPKSNKFITVKIITVAPELHEQFVKNNDVKNVPVLEYPAKNAGIRRAKGSYILSMNPDIIFDDKFFKDIPRLKKENYYRCNRFDFKLENKNLPSDNIISYAKKHISKIWVKAISKEIKVGSFSRYKFYLILLQQKMEIYSLTFSFLSKLNLDPKAEYKFHCNVSGDFMLMHNDNWQQLKAYKENSFLALHVDALMVVQAATLGLKEQVFSYPIYHQEHTRRYDADKENRDFRDAYLIFQNDAQRMIKEKKPMLFNNQNWGFENSELEEILL
jgi:hypothetical protein